MELWNQYFCLEFYASVFPSWFSSSFVHPFLLLLDRFVCPQLLTETLRMCCLCSFSYWDVFGCVKVFSPHLALNFSDCVVELVCDGEERSLLLVIC